MRKPWLRLYVDLIDSEKIQTLPPEDFRLLINLWCLAKECDGVLPSPARIAWRLRDVTGDVTVALQRLVRDGLLDEKDGVLTPHDWAEHQYEHSGSRDRMRKYRERQRSEKKEVTERDAKKSVTRASHKRHCDAPDTDTDTDTDSDTDSSSSEPVSKFSFSSSPGMASVGKLLKIPNPDDDPRRARDLTEWEAVLRSRHGPLCDPTGIRQMVESDLALRGVPVEDFLALDEAKTRDPRKISNPGAYYRTLAKQARPAPPKPAAKTPRCPHCGSIPGKGVEPGSSPMRPCQECSTGPEAIAWLVRSGFIPDPETGKIRELKPAPSVRAPKLVAAGGAR